MKRMRIRFDSKDNVLKLSAPRGVSYNDMKDFLKDCEPWILKHIAPLEGSFLFKHEVAFPLLGKEVKIVHQERARPEGIEIIERTLHVAGPEPLLNNMVCYFLRNHARQKFTKRCHHYASQIGKSFKNVTIRDPKSRWGSCSAKGNISLSWRLLFAPVEVSNYVCAHEVAHLKEMNHSPAFWKIVGDLHPAPQESRLWLKRNGESLFRYG
jgi:predicted metal-dependent hydrolase